MVPKTETKTERSRRSPEQIIADHEAEIARIKARAAAREAKARPEAMALIAAVRAVEKAGRVAAEAGNQEVATAVEAARAALAPALVGLGLRPRGRGRKGTEAA